MESQTHKRSNRVVYIVDGARTPFLKFRGEPGPFSAADLAVNNLRPLLARQPFAPSDFDEVIVGCVGPSEEEANIARIIALRAGCGDKMPAFTVARNCASGLQSIDSAYKDIQLGNADLVLAGGTEAMSRAPLMFSKKMVKWFSHLNKAKTVGKKVKVAASFRPGFLSPVVALLKGLTDPVVNLSMGQTAEELSYRFQISREQMDQYALDSHHKTMKAYDNGLMNEVLPIYSWDGQVFEKDDGIRETTLEKLAKLKPAFEKGGNITPGNSSQITDGSAFVILASEDAVKKYNLPTIGQIVDVEWAALDPSVMGLGPVHAMTPLLVRNQLKLDDIDHVEINEAFAAQVLACQRAWADDDYCRENLQLDKAMGEIDNEKLNPDGGAISVGHPVGASGTRLVIHALERLNHDKTQYALASLCIGGGQGGAILLKRTA